jgi:predicted metal-dependent phosphoesterase TrpH
MTTGELIEAAIDAGLDGVAVTEHLVIEGAEVAQELARRKYGFPVFRGVEAKATIFGDVLVFGCYRNFEPQMTWLALRHIVAASGGVLIPAHPFRRLHVPPLSSYLEQHSLDLDARLAGLDVMQGLTAIEVLNGGCRREANELAAELARILNLPGVGGSDAHERKYVGRVATRFPGTITTDAELVAALKHGSYRPVDRRGGKR